MCLLSVMMAKSVTVKVDDIKRNSAGIAREEKVIVATTDMDYFEDDLYEYIVKNDRIAVLEYLRRGLSPNHVFRSLERSPRLGNTLLDVAVLQGATDVVRVLISRKCDVNLKYIVNINQFTYQLEEYKKRDRLKMMCIYRCIVTNDLPMIKLLVDGGFDVNLCDERGCTSIWHAADLNNYEMVKLLLRSSTADVDKADVAKLRPLHIASMKGNVKMTSLLIQRGAGVDAVQLRGSTPLILACRAASFDTVRILLLNGADPNHVGFNGHNVISTSLQYTTDPRIPEMLLSCGALVDHELVDICHKEGKKFMLLKAHPEFYETLKECSKIPRPMKTLCCLLIRRTLVNSSTQMHLIKKVEILPLPRLIKDFLLFGHV